MKRTMLLLLTLCLLLAFSACGAPAATAPATVPTESTTQPPPETQAATEPTFAAYTVMICRVDFPIYSGPSYDEAPVGTVQFATLYTILEEVTDQEGNLWGRLKSGAGWVDLTLNEKETAQMPPVTVSRLDGTLPEDHYTCQADTSEYAYDIVLRPHEPLQDVSFYPIIIDQDYSPGPELLFIANWEETKPLVASVSFPGSASLYGLTFTDSQGVTHTYSIWESGRNGSVGISPLEP